MIGLLPDPGILAHLQDALLHSLWQGLALGILLYLFLRAVPAARPNLRYAAALATLVLLVLAVPLTWGTLAYESPSKNLALYDPITAPQIVPIESASPTTAPDSNAHKSLTPEEISSQSSSARSEMLLGLWLAGVLLMLVRAWRLHAGAERLCRDSAPLDDQGIALLVTTLKDELGIARDITVRVGQSLTSPAVAGLLSPVLLLPAQFATGLSPEQLRAVLAHELAHIRRYDYLVNFLQLIVEAVLYFNPAVWWISRQIRIEREACCDALAVSVTNAPDTYADALAGLSRELHTAAQYASGDRTPNSMTERIRRLLIPGYRPRLRWYGLAFAMATSMVALAVLSTGSFTLAGWIMSDEERVAKIEEVLETHTSVYENVDYEDLPQSTISGTIRSHTGALVSDINDNNGLPKCHLNANISRGNHYIGHGFTQRGGHFRTKIPAGVVHILAHMEGYAPVILGPLRIEADEVRENIEIVLPEAIPTYISFQDTSGNVVTDVDVSGFYKITSSTGTGGFGGKFTEDDRFVFAQNAEPITVSIEVESTGFAPETRRDLMILPGETYTWVLRESTPVTGRIVDEATGAPIAGAQISRIAEVHRSWIDDEEGATLLTTTDDAGEFSLRDLNPALGHVFQVRARGYGTDYLIHEVGRTELDDFPMGPRRDLSGTVTGDLSRLAQDHRSGRPIIRGGILIEHNALTRFRAFVDDDGTFTFRDIPRGRFNLYSNALNDSLQVTESLHDLEFTIPALLPTRDVVLRLVPPAGASAPTGTMAISTIDQDRRYMREQDYPIIDGTVRVPVPVPSTIYVGAGSMPGYYPEVAESPFHNRIEIPAGATELTLEIPLKRSGAIYGELFGPDGAPYIGDFQARVEIDPRSDDAVKMNPVQHDANREPEENRFVCAPLPLGARYRVSISAGLNWIDSEWITLNTRSPVENIRIQLPEGTDIPVRIIDTAGTGVGGAVLTLNCDGRSHRGFVTDGEGRYVFQNINPDYAPEYWVEVDSVGQLAGMRAPLKFDGTETVVQLREGVALRGIVIEENTKEPVAGVPVYASPDGFNFSDRLKTTTNARGEFEFAALEAIPHAFSVDADGYQMLYGPNAEPPTGIGGQDELVTITVRR